MCTGGGRICNLKQGSPSQERVVECYFWIAGVYFEPCYSRGRIILTKVLAIVSILDDIYHVYGSPEECEQFTKCIERSVFSHIWIQLFIYCE